MLEFIHPSIFYAHYISYTQVRGRLLEPLTSCHTTKAWFHHWQVANGETKIPTHIHTSTDNLEFLIFFTCYILHVNLVEPGSLLFTSVSVVQLGCGSETLAGLQLCYDESMPLSMVLKRDFHHAFSPVPLPFRL